MTLADGSVVTGTPKEVAETISLMNAAASAQPTPTATLEPAPSTSTGPQDNVPLTQADVDARVAEALERLKREPWHKRARSFVSGSITSLLINTLLFGLVVGLFALAYSGHLGHPLGWRTLILSAVIVAAVKGWNIGTRNKAEAETRAKVLEEVKKVSPKRGA